MPERRENTNIPKADEILAESSMREILEELSMHSERENIDTLIQVLSKKIETPSDSGELQRLRQLIADAARYIGKRIKEVEKCIATLEELRAAQPYLEAELKKPQYKGVALDDPIEPDKNGGIIPGSLLDAIRNARLAQMAAENLPKLEGGGTPKYYTSPNTALANAIEAIDGKGEVIGAGAIDIPVLNVGKSNEVTIYVNAALENIEGVTVAGKPYTEYDRAVHDAVVSIYEDRTKKGAPPIMTPDMIYRTMTHKTNKEYVSEQQKETIEKSVEKMRKNISVYADATAEIQRRKINVNGKQIDRFVIDGFLLPAEKIDVESGGGNITAYLIKGEPILLKYAKLTNQLITVKGNLLDIREVDAEGNITDTPIANNENRIAIKSYLLRRIEIMRSDGAKAVAALRRYNKQRSKDETLPIRKASDFRKQSRIILFESIFTAAGIANVNTKTNSREYVYRILDYWQASGSIKGYKRRKKDKCNVVDAVLIDL